MIPMRTESPGVMAAVYAGFFIALLLTPLAHTTVNAYASPYDVTYADVPLSPYSLATTVPFAMDAEGVIPSTNACGR